jgi:hypothetical protein
LAGGDLVSAPLPRADAPERVGALDVVRLLRNAELVRDAYRREGEWRYRVRERPGNAPSWRVDLEVVLVIVSDEQLQAHTVYRRR